MLDPYAFFFTFAFHDKTTQYHCTRTKCKHWDSYKTQSFKYQELLPKLFVFPVGIKNLLFQITDLYCKTQQQSVLNYTHDPLRALTFEMQMYHITS